MIHPGDVEAAGPRRAVAADLAGPACGGAAGRRRAGGRGDADSAGAGVTGRGGWHRPAGGVHRQAVLDPAGGSRSPGSSCAGWRGRERAARHCSPGRPVRAAEKTAIADQVAEAVDKGKLARLASLSVSSSTGAGLLAAAMTAMAETATARMI